VSGWVEITKDIFFGALAAALFGTVIYRAIWLRDVSGVTSLVFGALVCAVIVGISRFEFIALSGTRLEARARAVIQQAEVSQREFLKLAELTGELLIDLNAAQGRFIGGGDGAARDRRKSELLRSLGSFGVPQEELKKIAAADRIQCRRLRSRNYKRCRENDTKRAHRGVAKGRLSNPDLRNYNDGHEPSNSGTVARQFRSIERSNPRADRGL